MTRTLGSRGRRRCSLPQRRSTRCVAGPAPGPSRGGVVRDKVRGPLSTGSGFRVVQRRGRARPASTRPCSGDRSVARREGFEPSTLSSEDSQCATRETCRPAMSRGGSAASCRSRPSASISGRRCQRKSRSPLSVASTSKEPQGDLLTASSSRGDERRRRTRARGLHVGGPRDVFAACGNTTRTRVGWANAPWLLAASRRMAVSRVGLRRSW